MHRYTRATTVGLAVTFLLFFAAGSPAGPDRAVAELRFVVAEDYAGFSSVSVTTDERPPKGVTAIEGQEGVRYHRRDLAGSGRLLLSVRLGTEQAWIRVDRNFDGDLRDEEPVNFTGTATSRTAIVRLRLDLGGEVLEVPIRFTYQSVSGNTSLLLTVPVRREGAVVLAGRLRAVALTDGDGDLDFSGAGDGLLLDVDGDTELGRGIPSPDRIVPGKPFRLLDRAWVARIEDAGRVTFDPVEGEPPPPIVAWPRFGTPARGVAAGGETAPLADLLREYRAAGERDAKQNATTYNERQQVLNRIGRVGTDDAFRALLKFYDEESDANLKAAVLRATGYREYAPHATRLFEIARSSASGNLVNAAITALHGMDAKGFTDLLVELVNGTGDDSVFSTAARHLGYERSAPARALLVEKARSDPSPARRRHAYEAATRQAEEPPPADLVRLAARAEDPWHRALGLEHAFLLALPDARDLAIAALGSGEERVLLEAVRILGAAGDADSVKAILGLADPTPPVVNRVVTLLRAVRDEATAGSLAAALADRHAGTRLLVARVLGGLPFPAALEALAARVREEKDPAVLAALLRALGEHETEAATAAVLKAAAAARKNPDALAAALDALTRLGYARADVRRFLESLASSRDPLERMLAVEAAGKTGSAEAADLILGAVADPEWRVRLTAAQALGRVRVKRAVPVLIDRLEREEVGRVKEAVAESLFRVTGQNFYDLPDLWRRWWEESGAGFEVPEAVPERPPDTHGGASTASFYGVPVNSDRIVFVID
ncbi:MAG: HEAT repeat domain-containing protein, partial [Planctomycetes bacterium]|nr:HEAT repeat domain-containing protein [Planctomycetota bacterium]